MASAGGNLPLEITAAKKKGIAIIGIKGYIYSWGKASSMDVEATIKGFKEDGITDAEVYINSGGGDVFEANEILNLIEDNFKKVTVRAGALVASAATRFLAKYKSSAKRNSMIMIHKPMGSFSGNVDEVEAKMKLLKDMTKQYKAAYAKKMKITEAEVEKLWSKGDYWMTAKEALKKGLIDSIEDEDEKIDAATRLQLVACGAPNIPIAKDNNQNQIKHMELSVLAVQLGLPSTATQPEVDAKIKDLQAKAASADGLVKAAADQKKAGIAAEKKTLLDAAEKGKKITAEQRPHFETMEVDALKAVLEGMKSIEAISTELNPGSGDGAAKAGREKWTYADYQQKDPDGFEKLEEAAQKTLIDAHYKEE